MVELKLSHHVAWLSASSEGLNSIKNHSLAKTIFVAERSIGWLELLRSHRLQNPQN